MNLISLLRRMSTSLLIVGSFICIFGSFLMLAYTLSYYDLLREGQRYESWVSSGDEKVCRIIGLKCSGFIPGQSEVYVPDMYSELISLESMIEGAVGTERARLLAMVKLDECFKYEVSRANVSCLFLPPSESLKDRFLKNISSGQFFLIGWLLFLVPLLLLHVFLRERYAGGRIFSILLTLLCGLIFWVMAWKVFELNDDISFVVAIVGFFVGLAILSLLRLLVFAGLPGYRSCDFLAPNDQSEAPIVLSWKITAILVLFVLCVGGVAVVVINSGESILLAAIQGAVLALAGWFVSSRNESKKHR